MIKVMVLGLRGFPQVQGGVETHAEHLYPLLRDLGCEVDVIVRSPYMSVEQCKGLQGINYHRLWAPKSKGLEALVHTFLGVLYAGIQRPDILHIHAIGPALWVPLARLLGLKVVVTHHGPDYDRQKWGGFARNVLKQGENWGMRFANARIVISRVVETIVRQKYGLASFVIPNAVKIPSRIETDKALKRFDLESGKYVLLVSRMVPEKRHLDLIEAFEKAQTGDWKLVIVGASDHIDEYERKVINRINSMPNAVSTGFQSGQALEELYAHAGLFVLPSSHEGLPIAMLEALSYGLPVLASSIPANVEVGLPDEQYFSLGGVEQLADLISKFLQQGVSQEKRREISNWVALRYRWDDVAQQTLSVYEKSA